MKRKKQYSKRYFFKPDKETDIYSVKDDFFEDLDWPQAFCYGLNTFIELYKTLKEDAVLGDDSFIGNMKVTTGLERFLIKLNEKFPYLLSNIKSMELKSSGIKVFKC